MHNDSGATDAHQTNLPVGVHHLSGPPGSLRSAAFCESADLPAFFPSYICHKEVRAVKIKDITNTRGVLGSSMEGWALIPEEGGIGPIPVSSEWYLNHKPVAGGYYVVYKDGYSSFSPAEAFEKGYSLVSRDPKPSTKTLHNSDQSGTRKNVKDVKVFGNTDMFQLLCKASSEAQGWMKCTKALEIPSVGCIVQATTQQRNDDGSYAVAEALTFVPGVCIVPDSNPAPASTPTGRQLVPSNMPSIPLEPTTETVSQGLATMVGRYLDSITITSDNIGEIRRSLFMPFECGWNGWVRDETANRENIVPPRSEATEGYGEMRGRIAYNAYCASVGWKSFNGDALPQWPDVRKDIKSAWIETGMAVWCSMVQNTSFPPANVKLPDGEGREFFGMVETYFSLIKGWRNSLATVLLEMESLVPDTTMQVELRRAEENAIVRLSEAVMWCRVLLEAEPQEETWEQPGSTRMFRKKPVVIEAVQWNGTNDAEIRAFVPEKDLVFPNHVTGFLTIKTLEGNMEASVGDFIIKGIKGEFYPCKPDIFAQTYDSVVSCEH
jgi:hypothetical protein